MNKSVLILFAVFTFFSCKKEDDFLNQFGEVCEFKAKILSPDGYELNNIGNIEFNGTVHAFQMVNDLIGFAMLQNNVGGYVVVFKTIDGGQTWINLHVGINQLPRNMIFRDENFGIITVFDVTGCPPPNCLNKCVILKTEDGGLSWEEIEFVELKGSLNHPKYDNNGNLYANLNLNDTSAIIKSNDDGETWDTLYFSPELNYRLVTFCFEIYQDKIYTTTRDGNIIILNTSGQIIKTVVIDNFSIWDLEIIDENNFIVVQSGKVMKTTDGGNTWEQIYGKSARMIGFESIDIGLMLLNKSSCPTDYYQANDKIASTINGGLNWVESKETTTNLRSNYVDGQKMSNGKWFLFIDNDLIELRKN